jgi:cholesterol oxidase
MPAPPDYDAVVVGSGFGGSISALRIAEQGRSVLVLERGRRYRPGEFPRDVRDTNALLWRYPRKPRSVGLFDLRFFSSLAAVVASGVGGGSLIYANIHIRPDPVVFDDPRWPSGTNRLALDPYYDRVADKLEIAPLPASIALPKRDAYRTAADRLGRPVFDPDEAVSWTDPGAPGRAACQLVAECEFGCQHGAKNTVDLTYLAEAELLGAEVLPGALVTGVEPGGPGYLVRYRDVASSAEHTVGARRVVLAAGTLGTNELLLRCRDIARTLPGLSPRLGCGYSANGDFLASVEGCEVDLDPWHGPDVTSVISWFDRDPRFTMAAPTFDRSVMAVLTSLGQGRGRLSRPLANLLWPLFGRATPWALRLGLLSRPLRLPWRRTPDPDRTTFLFAIGRDDAGGTLRLCRGRLDVDWAYARRNEALIERMTDAMADVAGELGGSFAPLFTWLLFRRITTVHSLGGCHLSTSPKDGVVAPNGEVHGYPGLFVADGSVVPTAIGFHPVMTISALAERTADHVARSFA